MTAWRTLASVVVALAVVRCGYGQTYSLVETSKAGDCARLHLEMKLTGELRVVRDGKVAPVPLAATAVHEFPERILAVDPTGLPTKVARVYEQAQAVIRFNNEPSERTLRPDRRLIVAQCPKDEILVYAPAGPLTREELDLTSQHFDTLHVTGLLPGRAVSVGETWKVGNGVAQGLCAFEGLTAQDLACKLEAVQDNVATVSFKGTASGIDTGASVKLTVTGSYRFDLNQKRLVALEWSQKDDREQGPASPAMAGELTTTLQRKVIEQPNSLSDVALVSVPDDFEVPPVMTQLLYRAPKSRFELALGREWHLVGQTEDHVILRLMERGDFVAQVTLTPWTKAEPGKHLTPEEFKQAMSETTGWEPEQELQADEVPLDGDRWCYRLLQAGKLDGIKVTQSFYVVASPTGEQLVLAFTMTPAQVAKLGTRDLALVGSLSFPAKK